MRSTLTSLYRNIFASPKGEPRSDKALLEGLRFMESWAIEHLMAKTAASVRYLVQKAGLPDNLARDVLHDALVILIKKIRDDIYDPAESAPSTYLIAIAHKLVANRARKQHKLRYVSLDHADELPDPHAQAYMEGRDRREMLEQLLTELGDPCAQLIRLKYLDGYRDEEILEQGLTHYNTSMALRSKRSKCFQKLMELAASTKSANATISTHNSASSHQHHQNDTP